MNLIDSFYALPVMIEHFDHPTPLTIDTLRGLGFSYEDIEKQRKIRHLLEYHLNFIRSGVANYPLLRSGLSEYFNEYLYPIFNITGLVGLKGLMLDYGCGDGSYADQYLKDNPDSTVMCVDKVLNLKNPEVDEKFQQAVDFEKEPDWWMNYRRKFQTILLSEILHCKDYKGQQYLIRSSFEMLESGGFLVINENEDYPMQYRISKLKGQFYPLVTAVDLHNLTEPYALKLKNYTRLNKHHISVYEKI